MKRSILFVASCSLFLLAVTLAADDGPKVKFPKEKDDVSLVRIKADPETARDKRIVICGYVTVSDYYNFGYRDSQNTHYSLRFREAGEYIGDETDERAWLYFLKDVGRKPVEVIIEAAEKKKWKVVRAEVTLLGKDWEMLELLDLQFYDIAKKQWEPWILKGAKEAAQKEKLAQAKAQTEQKAAEKAKKAEVQKNVKEANKRNEKMAASRLKIAKTILANDKAVGTRKLKEIVEDHPDTNSAKEAQKLLDQSGS